MGRVDIQEVDSTWNCGILPAVGMLTKLCVSPQTAHGAQACCGPLSRRGAKSTIYKRAGLRLSVAAVDDGFTDRNLQDSGCGLRIGGFERSGLSSQYFYKDVHWSVWVSGPNLEHTSITTLCDFRREGQIRSNRARSL